MPFLKPITLEMEVVDQAKIVDFIGGKEVFLHTCVVVSNNGNMFLAKSSQATRLPDKISRECLTDVEPIHPASYCPALPAGATVATRNEDFYVKRPRLLSATSTSDLAALVLQELDVCETIRNRPQQNLAEYHGCLVTDGLITGLCFTKYPQTLMSKLNPGSINKSAFIMSNELAGARAEAAQRYLPGIEAGIRHLHDLDIVHNDLNPANIAITENDVPILIDFDSCSAPGATLDNTKQTHGWYDKEWQEAQMSNDMKAFNEIQFWLAASSPEQLQFEKY